MTPLIGIISTPVIHWFSALYRGELTTLVLGSHFAQGRCRICRPQCTWGEKTRGVGPKLPWDFHVKGWEKTHEKMHVKMQDAGVRILRLGLKFEPQKTKNRPFLWLKFDTQTEGLGDGLSFFFLIIWNSGKMKTFWWIFFSIGLKLPRAGLFIRFSTGVEGKFPTESLYKGILNFETVRGAEKMLPEAFLWMPGGLASSGDIFHLFLLWLEAPLLRFREKKHCFFCGFPGLNNNSGWRCLREIAV